MSSEIVPLAIQERALYLQHILQKYSHHYYNLHESLVSDQEFDLLLKELEALEKQYPTLENTNSITQKVGSPITPPINHSDKVYNNFQTVKHLHKMYSLSNA